MCFLFVKMKKVAIFAVINTEYYAKHEKGTAVGQ